MHLCRSTVDKVRRGPTSVWVCIASVDTRKGGEYTAVEWFTEGLNTAELVETKALA
jgi:hypothetical protein